MNTERDIAAALGLEWSDIEERWLPMSVKSATLPARIEAALRAAAETGWNRADWRDVTPDGVAAGIAALRGEDDG
jgi:hypothetical protein